MLFNNNVTDITQDKIVPLIIDQTLDSNVYMARLFQGSVKRWSGHILRQPIQLSNPTNNGGSFDGVDVFNTNLPNNTNVLSFEPKAYYQSVVISGIEEAVNETDAQILSLIKSSMEIAKNSMCDQIGTLLYGTGAGKDFQGLGAIVDDGTDAGTYGQLSRSTHTQLQSDVTASGGTLTLDLLAQSMRAASAASSASQRPTLGLTTELVWDLYESLLTPTVQANYSSNGYPLVSAFTKPGRSVPNEQALRGAQGFDSLTYRGRPLVADEKQTSGVFHWINENYHNWFSLMSKKLKSYNQSGEVVDGVYKESKKKYPVQWKELQTPDAQFAEVGQFILMGNYVGTQPRRDAKLTGITTA